MERPPKTSRLTTPLGVLVGLLAALLVLPFVMGGEDSKAQSEVGPILPDNDGRITELVIQYKPDSNEIVIPPYRDFLGALPPEVVVHVVCPGEDAFAELIKQIGKVQCTLTPVYAAHPMTSWSRDRWIAFEPGGDGRVTLLSPKGELGADAWAARKGDEKIGRTLAAKLNDLNAVRSELYFDGGDFVADGETVFVTPNVLSRNIQRTVKDRNELLSRLRDILGRKVVLLEDAPDHHAGMYMMTAGNRTVIVGDPRLARDMLSEDEASALPLPGIPDFRDETLARFDAVAEQCEANGYTVIRIPVAPATDGRTFITYLNSILDQRDGRRIVYMPVFDGAEKLNAAAAEAWKQAGFTVVPVDCTSCYRHYGSLRCLVNVLRRG